MFFELNAFESNCSPLFGNRLVQLRPVLSCTKQNGRIRGVSPASSEDYLELKLLNEDPNPKAETVCSAMVSFKYLVIPDHSPADLIP